MSSNLANNLINFSFCVFTLSTAGYKDCTISTTTNQISAGLFFVDCLSRFVWRDIICEGNIKGFQSQKFSRVLHVSPYSPNSNLEMAHL